MVQRRTEGQGVHSGPYRTNMHIITRIITTIITPVIVNVLLDSGRFVAQSLFVYGAL